MMGEKGRGKSVYNGRWIHISEFFFSFFLALLSWTVYSFVALPDTYTTHTMSSSSTHGGWKAYEYYPSMAAAVIFIILFVAVTFLHTYHLIRTRTWFFIPLVLGGYCTFLCPSCSK